MKKLILYIILYFACFHFINAQSLQEALSDKIDIIIAKDGSGDYETFQGAINAVPDNQTERTLIFVKKGVYNERVQILASKRNLTIVGEDVQETILTYLDYAGLNPEIYVLQVLANDVWLMNLTIENQQGYQYAGPQALALNTKKCDRSILYHCKLFSFQDTWYINTIYRAYAKDCFIEGAVDYIYGPAISVFDSCVLFCNRSSGAVITAANTNQDDLDPPYNKFGFVFFNSKIMSMPGWGNISLGRPWRAFANVVYYKCDEGDYVIPQGWTEMHYKKDSAYFREFRCTGSSSIKNRITFANAGALPGEKAYSYSLTDTNAAYAIPCFDSLFHPNVLPSKRGTLTSGWNPDDALKNDKDSVFSILNRYIRTYMDTIGYTNTNIIQLKYDTINISLDTSESITVVNDIDVADANKFLYPVFEYPGCGYIAIQPDAIPGMGTISVVAKDRKTSKTYKLYFDKDNAFTNAKIQRIKLDTVTLPEFNPDVFEYNYVLNDYLAERISKDFSIRINAEGYVNDAEVKYTNQSFKEIPNTSTISVTAPDGVTQNTYTIHFQMPTDIQKVNAGIYRPVFMNPVTDNLKCLLNMPVKSNISLKLYNENGSLVLEKEFYDQPAGQSELILSIGNLNKGIYIYKLETKLNTYSGKLIKN